VDTGLEGFTCFEQFKALQKSDTPTQRRAGSAMTYTSGTTGRPKGVRRAVFECEPETVSSQQALFLSLFDMPPGSSHVHLAVAPLYHTAVLNFATNHLHLGHTVVLMDGWTPEGMLQRVQAYRVTTSHMVPTMFIRLLKMDQTERLQYDVSSLSHVVHGAAPCPLEIKHQMLDWWGDTIFEYYAASEGGGTLVSAKQWRQKPGTVGPPWPISEIEIRDDDEELVPAGTIGTVWIAMGDYRFSYHGDDAKTRDAWRERFFTVGDAGYLDSEGWLFLSDRKSDMMISGGVNIYPAEIEAVLLQHPEVMDVAVFGIPDEDWGESVHARLQLRGMPDHFDEEIRGFCQDKLARFKQPKTYSYVQQLPRDPNGKLSKSKLRQSYLASLKLS
jgi:long-chain acyl-CoA synthetase